MANEQLEFQLTPYTDSDPFDLDAIIFDLDGQIDLLASHADNFDYIISIASGIACSMLDILWFGEIDLLAGREIVSEKIDNFGNIIGERCLIEIRSFLCYNSVHIKKLNVCENVYIKRISGEVN